MAGKTINPTRMELTRLKGRLKTATRGHKLLKDKRDELMKQFMDIVRRNRVLRKRVEEGLAQANAAFTVRRDVAGDAGGGAAVPEAERGTGCDLPQHYECGCAGVSLQDHQ